MSPISLCTGLKALANFLGLAPIAKRRSVTQRAMATPAAAPPAAPVVSTSFDAVLSFAKLHRDQLLELVDSIQDEPVPIAIKETWKKTSSSPKGAFCDYIATRIRAEPGIPESVVDKLVQIIQPGMVEELLDTLRPKRGCEEKAIRKVRVHKATGEGFLLLDSEDSPEVEREFHVFKLVIGKRKDFDDNKIFKFKLQGTLYRRILNQSLYDLLAPNFAAAHQKADLTEAGQLHGRGYVLY